MIALLALACGEAPAVDTRFSGICDASAAWRAPDGSLWVADDEHQALYVFAPGGGAAQRSIPLGLGNAEADLEGAAQLGDRVWWIASHGRNKNAEPQPARQVLVATSTTGAVLGSATALLPGLLTHPDVGPLLTAAEPKAPKEGGIAIEGLASDGDALWLGFRSPLDPEGRAIVVRLDHPGQLLEGTPPALGPAEHLDLGGLGIRSLEHANGTWWIVAGGADTTPGSRLFRWAGSGTVPEPLVADLAGLNPEALVALPDGRLQIFSDDGTQSVAGGECKQAAVSLQSFRARVLQP